MFKSSGIIAKVSRKIAVALVVLGLGFQPAQAQIICTASLGMQISIGAQNLLGFTLIALMSEVGEPIASSWDDFSDSNEEILHALGEALVAQNNAFKQDNDDFEQLTEARFFARTSADAAKLAYLHRIASALGQAGSGDNALSQPVYAGNSVYDFHKQVLNANFVLRRDNLGYLIEGGQFNLIDSDISSICDDLPEGIPGGLFSFCQEEASLSDPEAAQTALSVERLKAIRDKIANRLAGSSGQNLGEIEVAQALSAIQSLDEVSK